MREEDALEDMIRVGSGDEKIPGFRETSINDPDDVSNGTFERIFPNLPSFVDEEP